VHISELDWKKVSHPSEIAQTGETLEVQIVDIDRARERVSLSRKTLIPGPWDEVESKYKPGNLVPVRITNVVDFGAFGELSAGLQGLIHTSELGYTVPGAESDTPEPGETVLVKILRIEPERERIGLSMRQVPAEKQLDWLLGKLESHAENASEKEA
jgi:ribosomal protein S1